MTKFFFFVYLFIYSCSQAPVYEQEKGEQKLHQNSDGVLAHDQVFSNIDTDEEQQNFSKNSKNSDNNYYDDDFESEKEEKIKSDKEINNDEKISSKDKDEEESIAIEDQPENTDVKVEDDVFSFWVNPNSQAASELNKQTPGTPIYDALQFIAAQPTGNWIGEWTNPVNPMAEVAAMSDAAFNDGGVPVFIVYAVPNRDCGQYSGGGFNNKQSYLDWVQGFTNGMQNRESIVVLEPDAVGLLDSCAASVPSFSISDQIDNLRQALAIVAQNQNAKIFLDVGHWVSANLTARRIEDVDPTGLLSGYSVNVSNYKATDRMERRCQDVYNALSNDSKLPCLIDTARNGNGGPKTASGQDVAGEASWCNPPGRALGPQAALFDDNPVVAGYFWLKPPGESDGECRRDEPAAGKFWLEQALGYYMESSYSE